MPDNPASGGKSRAFDRYAAAPDGALEFNPLKLGTPFAFDRSLARRLIRREVNAKEAFTVKDASGVFYRASVKELAEYGGSAVAYEQLSVSPEPAVEITLACAVLARQRMIFVVQKATELGVSRIVPLLTQHSVPVNGLEHEKATPGPARSSGRPSNAAAVPFPSCGRR